MGKRQTDTHLHWPTARQLRILQAGGYTGRSPTTQHEAQEAFLGLITHKTPHRGVATSIPPGVEDAQKFCVWIARKLFPGESFHFPGHVFRQAWGFLGIDRFLQALQREGYEGLTLIPHYAPKEDDVITITRSANDDV